MRGWPPFRPGRAGPDGDRVCLSMGAFSALLPVVKLAPIDQRIHFCLLATNMSY